MIADEHPKPQVTIEALAKLPTVFKKGKQKVNFFLVKVNCINRSIVKRSNINPPCNI